MKHGLNTGQMEKLPNYSAPKNPCFIRVQSVAKDFFRCARILSDGLKLAMNSR